MLQLDPFPSESSRPDDSATRHPGSSRFVDDLKPFLDGVKRRVMASLPADAMATILDSVERLVRSGIAERAISVGEKAPLFELPDGAGNPVNMDALTARGPVVATFFRGFW